MLDLAAVAGDAVLSKATRIDTDHPLIEAVYVMPAGNPNDPDRPRITGIPYLSPSQLKSYVRCATNYMLQYHPAFHMKEPTKSRTAFGTAVHKGAEHATIAIKDGLDEASVRLKAHEGLDLVLPIVLKDISVWEAAHYKGPLETAESFSATAHKAVDLLIPQLLEYNILTSEQGYLIIWRDRPDETHPILAERGVLPILAYTDFTALHENGAAEIIDIKTTSASAGKEFGDVMTDVALIAYGAAHEIATGIATENVTYEVILKHKVPKACRLTALYSDASVRRLYARARATTVGVAAGVYPPADTKYPCKDCFFIDKCEETYGPFLAPVKPAA